MYIRIIEHEACLIYQRDVSSAFCIADIPLCAPCNVANLKQLSMHVPRGELGELSYFAISRVLSMSNNRGFIRGGGINYFSIVMSVYR